MKVFISWSGERSRLVAELLNDWIQCVIQAVEPWMSSKDIDRGSLWFSEINNALANTSVGIVCLTKENKEKPWILFESGALAKGLSSSRVCTFLIDLESTELENPLAQFNHTTATRPGLLNLVRTINASLETEALSSKILDNVFETYWPQFEAAYQNIIQDTPEVIVKEKRNKDDILLEVLSSVRSMDKRMRTIEDDQGFRTINGNFEKSNAATEILIKIENLKMAGLTDAEIRSAISPSGAWSEKFVSDRPTLGIVNGKINLNTNKGK